MKDDLGYFKPFSIPRCAPAFPSFPLPLPFPTSALSPSSSPHLNPPLCRPRTDIVPLPPASICAFCIAYSEHDQCGERSIHSSDRSSPLSLLISQPSKPQSSHYRGFSVIIFAVNYRHSTARSTDCVAWLRMVAVNGTGAGEIFEGGVRSSGRGL